MIADRPDDFASAIVELLRNETQKAMIEENAYKHAMAHFTWKEKIAFLVSLYRGGNNV